MPGVRILAAMVVLLAPFLSGVSCGIGGPEVREATVAGEFSAAQVVPPVESGASGLVTAQIFADIVSLQGTFRDLEGALLADEPAVLLRLGARGENGATIAELPSASVDGRTGTFSGDFRLEPDLLDRMLDGGTYVEIRTEAHPSGEIRAQLE